MKILFALMLVCSTSAFANKLMVGENASPEYKNCLGEDKCPSQRCPNSCAMINNTQQGQDRNTVSAGPRGNSKSKAKSE